MANAGMQRRWAVPAATGRSATNLTRQRQFPAARQFQKFWLKGRIIRGGEQCPQSVELLVGCCRPRCRGGGPCPCGIRRPWRWWWRWRRWPHEWRIWRRRLVRRSHEQRRLVGHRISGGNWSGMSSSPGRSQFSHASSPGSVSNAARTQWFNNWNHPWNANHGMWGHDQGWWGNHEPDRTISTGSVCSVGRGSPSIGGRAIGGRITTITGYAPYGDVYGGYYNAAPYATSSPAPTYSAIPPSEASSAGRNAEHDGSGFFEQAVSAFRQGEYGQATRLAGHAAVDDPRNPNVHVLAMLGLFAMGEFAGRRWRPTP